MAEIKLTLTVDYVSRWTTADAVRELLQNAYDKETEDPANKATVRRVDGVVHISNFKSSLDRKSLLLGASSKATDTRTIGQFGEGYKLALLVLTREGKGVVIHNNGKKETWTPRIVNSTTFGAKVLAINISKRIFTKAPDANLEIVIEGITDEEWAQIVRNTRQLQAPSELDKSEHSYDDEIVLLDPAEKGRVYVNGLFVAEVKSNFGYDLKPCSIMLDRDRSLVRDFDIFWQTSELWHRLHEMGRVSFEEVQALMEKDAPDVSYIANRAYSSSKISENLTNAFVLKHGSGAYPVTSQDEFNRQKALGYNPVIVTAGTRDMIIRSPGFKPDTTSVQGESPRDLMVRLECALIGVDIGDEASALLSLAVEQSKDWQLKSK